MSPLSVRVPFVHVFSPQLSGQGDGSEEDLEGKIPAGFISLHRRLADIESMLGVHRDSSATAGVGADDEAGGHLLRCSK